jgi:hypothetical protein
MHIGGKEGRKEEENCIRLVTTRKRKKKESHIASGEHSRRRGDLESGNQVNSGTQTQTLKGITLGAERKLPKIN